MKTEILSSLYPLVWKDIPSEAEVHLPRTRRERIQWIFAKPVVGYQSKKASKTQRIVRTGFVWQPWVKISYPNLCRLEEVMCSVVIRGLGDPDSNSFSAPQPGPMERLEDFATTGGLLLNFQWGDWGSYWEVNALIIYQEEGFSLKRAWITREYRCLGLLYGLIGLSVLLFWVL